MDLAMKRGEIYYANLNPTIGREIAKRRPVLIVSNDINNKVSLTVTILPISSKIDRIYPFEVLLSKEVSGLPRDSKALAQQIRTISKERITREAIGLVTEQIMFDVNAAISLHLGLS